MKIGIITITDGQNYGNRLQNYALQTTLEKLGLEPETIHRKTFRDKNALKIRAKNIIKTFLGRYNPYPYYIRKKKFNEFNEKYVKFSKYSTGFNKAPQELKKSYDYFVCGSDQVWNPLIPIVIDDIESGFAQFADYNQRISYAASFGIKELPKEFENKFKNLLSGMRHISVREESGVKIVENLVGKEAKHVLDPTLLLSKEEWMKISEKPEWFNGKKFILTYFLGQPDAVLQQYIMKIAKEKSLEIIALNIEFLSNKEINNKDYFSVSPSEFVWLINSCSLMLTDSFHGSVFSIIFNKPFRVFNRKSVEEGNNMGTRIDTLFKLFGLNNYGNINEEINEIFDYNYKRYNEVIKIEQEKSIEYLKTSLSIK